MQGPRPCPASRALRLFLLFAGDKPRRRSGRRSYTQLAEAAAEAGGRPRPGTQEARAGPWADQAGSGALTLPSSSPGGSAPQPSLPAGPGPQTPLISCQELPPAPPRQSPERPLPGVSPHDKRNHVQRGTLTRGGARQPGSGTPLPLAQETGPTKTTGKQPAGRPGGSWEQALARPGGGQRLSTQLCPARDQEVTPPALLWPAGRGWGPRTAPATPRLAAPAGPPSTPSPPLLCRHAQVLCHIRPLWVLTVTGRQCRAGDVLGRQSGQRQSGQQHTDRGRGRAAPWRGSAGHQPALWVSPVAMETHSSTEAHLGEMSDLTSIKVIGIKVAWCHPETRGDQRAGWAAGRAGAAVMPHRWAQCGKPSATAELSLGAGPACMSLSPL